SRGGPQDARGEKQKWSDEPHDPSVAKWAIQTPLARNPPSTTIVSPVTNDDACEPRKIAAPTSSSTRPVRPIGVLEASAAARSGISSTFEFIGVRNTPGAIALTRTPCLAHSLARHSVSIRTPALLAQYGATSLKLTKLVSEH